MPNFRYRAVDSGGKEISGVVEAYTEVEAMDIIKQSYKVVTRISRVKEGKIGLDTTIGNPKIKETSISLMCAQFAILLKAGMPLLRAVQLVSGQTADKELKKILRLVSRDVAAGANLAHGFEKRGGKQLPVSFIETVRAGEESGTLELAFSNLNVYFDKRAKLKKKIKGAMIYPAVLSVLAVIVIAVILGLVMPQFLDLFVSMNIQLPWPTRILISISDFVAVNWLIMAIVLLCVIISALIWRRTPAGKLFFSQLALKIPFIGAIGMMNGASQLANTLSTMLTAGLSMVKAISICSKVLDNHYLASRLVYAESGIEEGRPLGSCLKQCDCFPDLLVEMAAVGDESGSIEETLATIGEYYDSESQMAAERALSALQPAITIVMGIIIGFVVIALYLPVFSMTGGMDVML